MNITVIGEKTVSAEFSQPIGLAEALGSMGFPVTMPCGGGHRCGNCTVEVEGELSPPEEKELRLLAGRPARARLACFVTVLGDCTVYLPGAKAHIQTDGVTLGFAPDRGTTGVGFAVDIGTTTVAVYAYDLPTGRELARDAFLNPQRSFGGDVISRIDAALKGSAGQLAAGIAGALGESFRRLCAGCGVAPAEVTAATVTGNTAMLYLLLGQDVTPLSRAPFVIDEWLGRTFPAARFGWEEFPAMAVYLPPTVSAFVGSDITCSMLSAQTAVTGEGTTLLIDIGTNGEMALFAGDRVVCCSTAAGPAFEGAGIRFGCMAGEGAVNTVAVQDGRVMYTVMGDTAPVGICGSGLIDAVAAFLELGLIDETGCIADEGTYVTEYEEEPALAIGDSGILLTARDIRAVQLAKSAICAGMLTLLEECGLSADEVDTLLLAGGFGSYIDCRRAAKIGLIPTALQDKARTVGNAAGRGAAAILLSHRAEMRATELAAGAQVLDLSTHPVFMEKYIDGMLFA